MAEAKTSGASAALVWFRAALGVVGLVALVIVVLNAGADKVLATLRAGLPWLPLLAALEGARIVCETASSYLAFGDLAARIPRMTLLRAHILGHSIAAVAPAPTVVNETIKATLVAPFVGAGAAASVGVINQAAVLISVGLFSIPCGAAILASSGGSLWFWACVVHAVVLVGCGLGLNALARAEGKWAPALFLARRFPRLAPRAEDFRGHASAYLKKDLFARGPVTALFLGRCLQAVQFGVAAYAVGIDSGFLRAMAAQGVNLVASAVFVFVPGGFGATEGAFTLADDLLGTTEAGATSLALLMRCTQLLWLLIGAGVAFFAPRTPRAPTAARERG